MKLRDGITTLSDLRQDGCLKARFPRSVDWTEAVTLNSSGGVAGGDTLTARFRVQAGARATFAAQAAERFYRVLPGQPSSTVRTEIDVEAGACAEWLPQETILFDRSAMDRVLTVNIAKGGWFLGIETLVFGRSAMGETVTTARIADTIRIRIDGKLVLHDAIRIDGEVAHALTRAAIGQGAAAVATLVLAGADAAWQLDDLRTALAPFEAGVSCWNGVLVARIAAKDGASARAAIAAGLAVLRDGRALPRVWNC